jgi:hypothetical protein
MWLLPSFSSPKKEQLPDEESVLSIEAFLSELADSSSRLDTALRQCKALHTSFKDAVAHVQKAFHDRQFMSTSSACHFKKESGGKYKQSATTA